MKALVTGIEGFAGSHLAACLRAAGDQVLGVVRPVVRGTVVAPPDGSLDSIAPVIEWNIAAPAPRAVQEQVAQFEPTCVFHLAALSIPADCGSRQPTANAWSTNVDGTRHVLELIRRLPKRPRLLFASSSQVYAPVDPRRPQVDETASLNPLSGYAQTKYEAELILSAAVRAGSVEAVIVRVFKHTGAGQSARLMIPEWARQFALGLQPVRIRSLNSWVDLSDVRDIARAYRLLADLSHPALLYNVGSGLNRRTGDLFQQLRALADPRARLVETDPGVHQEAIADCNRCAADTGWIPQIPLAQTLADTLAYWRDRAALGLA